MRFNTKKARIGMFQIFILMLSIVSFSYLVSGAGGASSVGMWGTEDWTMICEKIAGGSNGMDISAVQDLSQKEMLAKYYAECDEVYPLTPPVPQTIASNKQCKADALFEINDGILKNKVTPKSVVDQCKGNEDALSNLGDSDFLEGAQDNLDGGLDSNIKDEITKRIENGEGDGGKFLEEFNSNGNSGIRDQWMKETGFDYDGSGGVPKIEYRNDGKYGIKMTDGTLDLDPVKLKANSINDFNIKSGSNNIEINSDDMIPGARISQTGVGDQSRIGFENIFKVKVDNYQFSGLDKLEVMEDGFRFSGSGAKIETDSFSIVNNRGGVSIGTNGKSPLGFEKDYSTFEIGSDGKLTGSRLVGDTRTAVTFKDGSIFRDGSIVDTRAIDVGHITEGPSLKVIGSDGNVVAFNEKGILNPEDLGSVINEGDSITLMGPDKSYTLTNTAKGFSVTPVSPTTQPASTVVDVPTRSPEEVRRAIINSARKGVKPGVSGGAKNLLTSPSTLLTLVAAAGGVAALIALLKDD